VTTEERLENLERELARAKRRNRRLLAAVGLVAGVFAVAWIVPGTDTAHAVAGAGIANRAEAQGSGVPPVIRAGQFELVDGNGKVRAVLEVTKDRPRLALYDETGKSRVILNASKHGPGLALFDENGRIRALLNVSKDGPRLGLFGADEKGIWQAP